MKYSDFQQSEFYKFFNLMEQSSIKVDKDQKKFYFKTGGFQEHIDIYLYVNNDNLIIQSELYLDRKWIGNTKSINPFGSDISKSFIDLFLPKDHDKEFKKHLIHYLFNLRGDEQVVIPLHRAFIDFEESVPEIVPFLDVYRNNKNKMNKTTQNYNLIMENITQNQKDRLLIRIDSY